MRIRKAFTMIEVLLVVAIIVALGGIAFAVMGPARENARQQVCVSNLRQIGQAVRMYSDDCEGADAVEGQAMEYWMLGLPSLTNFHDSLAKYLKNRQVLFCPSYHERVPLAQLGSTYAWNASADGFKPLPYRFSEIVRARGGAAPLAVCEQHNHEFDGTEPRWEQKKVIVLRVNGHVQAR